MRDHSDRVVTEEPLEIRLAWPGEPAMRVAVTMRTPGADFELATGFLLAEGILAGDDRPHTVSYCRDEQLAGEQAYNVVTVELDAPPRRLPAARSTPVTSACGVCGTQSIDDIFPANTQPLVCDRQVDAQTVRDLPDRLRSAQPTFGVTGSVHAAGIFDMAGQCVIVREDVGRHNAVDKVFGARALGLTAYDESSVLCVSGRVGFDIVSKAATARIAVVTAVGGPSSLALELADKAGVTVCGFTRSNRFVTYTHPGRVHTV